ncbi:ZnF_C2H2 [Nesidiocoris tenuis]|uniref:ZnF_C2H2 n=1 Tax=Nesidiocoris tenuis TaxID=355587 RepID=A0ABN7ALW0_9HEMI|nr:ZnF_C2H2 [Nesidiocoris tenuis]
MTMDVRRRCVESSAAQFDRADSRDSEGSSSPIMSTVPPAPTVAPKPTKRSFDVAFLMAPDDNAKKRQELKMMSAGILQRYSGHSPPAAPSGDPDGAKLYESQAPLGLLIPSKHQEPMDDYSSKSAFTKVGIPPGRSEPVSPMVSPAVSPDLSYQDSLSPPPPPFYLKNVNQYFLPPGAKPSLTPSYMYQAPAPLPRHEKHNLRASPTESAFQGNFIKTTNEDKGTTSKRLFHNEAVQLPYAGLPAAMATAAYPFPAQVPALLTAAAAANVTAALLPSSLASFTLPAQNVCAKCNISFRMTSDLVYHMRSQHKSDNLLHDSNRRRREQDKLRCPVCNETFRERHHLTRHMTAHQDKDGDKVDDEGGATLRRRINK